MNNHNEKPSDTARSAERPYLRLTPWVFSLLIFATIISSAVITLAARLAYSTWDAAHAEAVIAFGIGFLVVAAIGLKLILTLRRFWSDCFTKRSNSTGSEPSRETMEPGLGDDLIGLLGSPGSERPGPEEFGRHFTARFGEVLPAIGTFVRNLRNRAKSLIGGLILSFLCFGILGTTGLLFQLWNISTVRLQTQRLEEQNELEPIPKPCLSAKWCSQNEGMLER